MSAPKPLLRLVSVLAGALLATASVGLAFGADAEAEEDNTRAVRVIEAPDETPSPAQPTLQLPSTAAPPAAAAPPPHPSDYPAQRKQTALGAIPIELEGHQPSGVIGRAASRPGCCGWCQGLIPRDHQEGRLRHPRGR